MRLFGNSFFIDDQTLEIVETPTRPSYQQPHNIRDYPRFADGNDALIARLILKEHGRQKHNGKYALRAHAKIRYDKPYD